MMMLLIVRTSCAIVSAQYCREWMEMFAYPACYENVVIIPHAVAAGELRPQASCKEYCSSGVETPQACVYLCVRVNIIKVRVPRQDAHHIANLAKWQ
jgi:hypothetical protein